MLGLQLQKKALAKTPQGPRAGQLASKAHQLACRCALQQPPPVTPLQAQSWRDPSHHETVLAWSQDPVSSTLRPPQGHLTKTSPSRERKRGREGEKEGRKEGRQTCMHGSKVYQIRPGQLLPTRSLSYSGILPCIRLPRGRAAQKGPISGAAGTAVVLRPAPSCTLSAQDKAFQ